MEAKAVLLHFAAKCRGVLRQNRGAFCGKIGRVLRQNGMRFAAKCDAICGKMEHVLRQNADCFSSNDLVLKQVKLCFYQLSDVKYCRDLC